MAKKKSSNSIKGPVLGKAKEPSAPKRKTGKAAAALKSKTGLKDLDGRLSKLKLCQARQRETLKDLKRLVDGFRTAGYAFALADKEARIRDVNNAFTDAFGMAKNEALGRRVSEFCDGSNDGKLLKAIESAVKENSGWQGEVVCKRADKKTFPSWVKISALKGKAGRVEGYAASILDITTFKKTEKRLQQMAHFDVLTSLPNRSLMLDRLRQAISHAKRHRYFIAVMLLDLDRFKEVNDTLGHHVGDRLLVEASNRLSKAVRESDTVARMGGDEFLVILPEIADPTNAAHLAQKFIDRLAAPFHLAGHKLFISGSIGIAMYPNDGPDPDSLVKNADTAMYHAKAQGKNNFKFFTEDINKSTIERFMLENRFRQALDKLEFHLNYQPKIDLKTGKISGAEALLRWYHPEQGNVKPSLFIPLAEETGLVVQLGEWALREACRQNMEWQKEGLRPIRISVNISARQFKRKDLINIVKEVLDETGLDRKYLMLEITESMIIDNVEETVTTLNQFRDMGIGISIDDFGTGYSSLNYLNRFSLDELKIDSSFISDISSAENKKVVNAIIALAHGLNHKVVAEGVETIEQLEFLRLNSCNEAQGYYFSKPLHAEEFHALLKSDPAFLH